MAGKVVPLEKRTFLPLPRDASLATLRADDDVATRVRGYLLGAPKVVQWCLEGRDLISRS